MKSATIQTLIVGSLLSIVNYSHSAPTMTLTDKQMDTISAGGQYSFVYGEAYAGTGTVIINSRSKGKENPNGTSMTKADLKLTASGSDLAAAAGGGSGTDSQYQSVYGETATDEGVIRMRVKTMAKTKKDGEVRMKTRIKIDVK